jgi:phosphoglycolate phosphatase
MANLIFDYDGTLHESIYIYAPAFRKAQKYLLDKKLIEPIIYTDKQISSWLGFTAKEMWEDFAPHLTQEEKGICSKIIGDEMLHLISQGKAQLYPNVKETLQHLKKQGHTLIFLSNCKTDYMNVHNEYFHLENYFTDFFCSEQYGFIPKHEIFSTIKSRYNGDFVIIGDRFQDLEIAIKHNLKSIGCSYGYGNDDELKAATNIIVDIEQLNLFLA